jgi:tRNA U34 5-methylaminomethyl-2-thiouridine-forming methyltransferase MnmC
MENPALTSPPPSRRLSIVDTADGSQTLYRPDINEHYHSLHGAVRESRHVYIDAGWKQCSQPHIHVLEMGFGTGLNAFLTALEAAEQGIGVSYTALEKYPLPPETLRALDYAEHPLFRQIHAATWEKPVALSPFFTLRKIETDFRNFRFDTDSYDVVYYDAFAPGKQAEVWSQELFDALFRAMHPAGILTTYCAQGAVRRRMRQSGFLVERIPGPPGKREMLRARKPATGTAADGSDRPQPAFSLLD